MATRIDNRLELLKTYTNTEFESNNYLLNELLWVLSQEWFGLTIEEITLRLGVKKPSEARNHWDLIRWYELKNVLRQLARIGALQRVGKDRIRLKEAETWMKAYHSAYPMGQHPSTTIQT